MRLPAIVRFPSLVAAAAALLVAVGGLLLPAGLPLGVVLQGAVLGSLTGLTALGLVLIYRANRIINFAQAEIGGLAASVAVILVAGKGLPYLVAAPVGLVVAVATGWLIDVTIVRRFFTAPRLIFIVATIGLAQILGALQIALPSLTTNLRPLATFTTPFQVHFRIGPLVFGGDHIVALVVVPLVLGGLAWFFAKTDVGIAVRAAADSHERALLLGIPVRRLSRVTWMLAAGLSGLSALLSAPIVGPNLGIISGPEVLLAPLAAAVIGRMESLPRTIAAAVGIGVFRQAVLWSYPRSSIVDVCLFVLVLGSLLLQRKQYSRVSDGGMGTYVAVSQARPIPAALAKLREVRIARGTLVALLMAAVLVLPALQSDATLTLFAYIAIYGILALSLVVLTGWSGQISLGQFAFAGVGAATTAALLVHAHQDLFVALLASSVVGALTAVLVGIPAVRIPGPFLAVTTLAFGVPVSTYLLNSSNFPMLTPTRLTRPILFHRLDLENRKVFYYFCLLVLVLAIVLVRNYRSVRTGRAVLAVRDNERAAAAYSIEPTGTKLTAFAFSGALAGIAGGLYVVALRGMPFSGFDPVGSLVIFTMVVIGGAGSLPGSLLGAVYVESAQYFLSGSERLLATGAGLLLLLLIAPGGLGELIYKVRDLFLRRLAAARGIAAPTLFGSAEDEPDGVLVPSAEPAASPVPEIGHPIGTSETPRPVIECRGVTAGYGPVTVLFDVNLSVSDGEIVALLGTNGAGKSTVLRVVSGLIRQRAGEVYFDGRDISGLSPVQRVREGLVSVPGGRGVFPSLTVADNIRLGGWIYKKDRSFIEATEQRIYDLFPILRTRADAKASLLSGGEQQMLTIAQALLCRPRVLMIDELSLGLAPSIVADLLAVVRDISASGTTVIVVEQSVNVATALAERAVFMEKGQVKFAGPTAELIGRADLLRSVFLRGHDAHRDDTRSTPRPDQNGGPRLKLESVSKAFGGVTAVTNVDLEVGAGEILGLIGSNGAGKTTLFDVCSGFLEPSSGRIMLGGVDVTAMGPSQRSLLGLGRTFQDARLFPSLTVEETLCTALERHLSARDPIACILGLDAVRRSEAEAREFVDALLELLRLERYRDSFVSELSTGTRRIVELGCALAHQPTVLLLDEPSSGIAQRESEALASILLDIRDITGTSMVLIEHDIPLVSSIADRMACLHLGEVIAEGSSTEVLEHPAVVASYLGDDEVTIRRSDTSHAEVELANVVGPAPSRSTRKAST